MVRWWPRTLCDTHNRSMPIVAFNIIWYICLNGKMYVFHIPFEFPQQYQKWFQTPTFSSNFVFFFVLVRMKNKVYYCNSRWWFQCTGTFTVTVTVTFSISLNWIPNKNIWLKISYLTHIFPMKRPITYQTERDINVENPQNTKSN